MSLNEMFSRRLGIVMAPDDGGAGAGSTDTEGTTTGDGKTSGQPDPSGASGGSDSKDKGPRIKELSDEAASYRTRLRQKEEEHEAALAKLKEFEDANKSEQEKLMEERDALKREREELAQQLHNVSLENAFIKASSAFDFIDLDDAVNAAMRLAESAGIEITQSKDGQWKGIEESLKKVVETKPHLLRKRPEGEGGDNGDNGKPKDPSGAPFNGNKDKGGLDVAALQKKFPALRGRVPTTNS